MYLYDILPNRLKEMKAEEIAKLFNRSISSVYYAIRHQLIHPILLVVVFKNKPTVQEKKTIQEKLNIPDECWVEIKGTNGSYKLSNYGRVKRVYKTKERFILPTLTTDGSLAVFLKLNEKYRLYRVNKLVAIHFLREPKANEFIWHKNRIKTDCYAENLQWMDKKEVISRIIRKQKSREVVALHPETKVVLHEFRSARSASKHLYYDFSTICKRCNGKIKNDSGYIFMWKDDYERIFGEII